MIQKEGYVATSRGWPTFFCILPETRQFFLCVVLGGRTRRLRRAQAYIASRLVSAGIDVRTWSPDEGFAMVKPLKQKARYVSLREFEADDPNS